MRKKGKVVRMEEFVIRIKEIQEEAQAVLKKTQVEMKKQADWHRGVQSWGLSTIEYKTSEVADS